MPIVLTWSDITIRLVCAFAAGALIGLNRSEHGRPAGLRTSILVCLAACVAMIQVNLLLPLAGRPSNSFVMNDLMRLPLGILSGMTLQMALLPGSVRVCTGPLDWRTQWTLISAATGGDRRPPRPRRN